MTMTEEYILIVIALFVAVCILLVFPRAKLQPARQEAQKKAVLRRMLEKTREGQKRNFIRVTPRKDAVYFSMVEKEISR
ncbi:hypothetical protein [Desulfovibrio sp. ZJ200]|uniref:hypothetical protein n=1 Tax=Desulfovibrio sp. ZJ200 TaxID=2709792 RepID=UPI0013EBF430|nr:hypothetical protein [Desulfovibrio sp. ZJ200]